MRKYLTALLSLALCASASADDARPDPEQWYREGYAPLWADQPGERVEEMLGYYADEVETHSSDGKISRENKADWLGAPMAEWLAEGWLSAELTGLKTDRINASTASFKARWLDHYKNTADEVSCGWYLADLQDGRWKFTVYADIDCAAHDL